MSNGLVLVGNETMAKVYSLNFHLYTDMNCLHFSGSAAVEHFKDLIPYLDVLIIDPTINGDNLIEQLDILFLEQNITIPTIVLSRLEVETESQCFTYMKDISVKSIIRMVGELLDVSAQDMVSKVVPDKVPLHINYFKDLITAPCDIFVRDGKDENGYKYNQLYEKGVAVDSELIGKIQREEKKSKLFIPKLERLKFVNSFTAQLTKTQTKSIKKNRAEKLSFIQMSRDNIASIIADKEGMEEIMDIADNSITECLQEIESQGDKRLTSYIDELFKATDSYYLQHAQLTSYIAFKLLEGLNWLSMSQKRTFISASFFKNILLSSNQEDLAKIRDEETLDNLKREGNISHEEYNLIRTMPQKTVNILASCKKQNFPENTLTIIREQYGNKTGVGFEKDLDKNLHSLSIAFIIANSYSDKILLDGIDEESIIIDELEREFKGETKFLSYIELLK